MKAVILAGSLGSRISEETHLKPKPMIKIVPDCAKATLQGVDPWAHCTHNTVIHSDGWRGYDGLVDIGFDKHFGSVALANVGGPIR